MIERFEPELTQYPPLCSINHGNAEVREYHRQPWGFPEQPAPAPVFAPVDKGVGVGQGFIETHGYQNLHRLY